MDFADIYALRQALHNSPERSGEEKRTRKMLMEFLASHTALELHPCGEGFYAAHRERSGRKPPIALRADYDALAPPGEERPISAAMTVMRRPCAARLSW